MKQKYEPIETLIERFFDGLTTNEEERVLYTYFQSVGDDLPEHLQEYRDTFSWFHAGITGEVAEKAPVYPLPVVDVEAALEMKVEAPTIDARPPRKVWMRWAAVAASVLLAVAFYSIYTMEREEASELEGYIIRNGVKITDRDVISSELEATMQMALMQEAKAEQLFRQLYEADDEYMTAGQQMQQQYCQIISQFSDPVVREAVEKMLDIQCND